MKEFKAYNIKGELKTFVIRDCEELIKTRCPRCGAFAVWCNSEWHSYNHCVVCNLSVLEWNDMKEQVEVIEKTIKNLKEELEFNSDLLNVISQKVPTVKRNMELKLTDCIVEDE